MRKELDIDILVGTWHRRVARHCRISAGTCSPGVNILWLGEIESVMGYICLSVAANETVYAGPRFLCWDFSRSSHTSDLKIGSPVPTLPTASLA